MLLVAVYKALPWEINVKSVIRTFEHSVYEPYNSLTLNLVFGVHYNINSNKYDRVGPCHYKIQSSQFTELRMCFYHRESLLLFIAASYNETPLTNLCSTLQDFDNGMSHVNSSTFWNVSTSSTKTITLILNVLLA